MHNFYILVAAGIYWGCKDAECVAFYTKGALNFVIYTNGDFV